MVFGLQVGLGAADFEIGPQAGDRVSTPAAAPAAPRRAADEGALTADYPLRIDAGDVPTAYALRKYDLVTDLRFYDGGGILAKAYLGLFPRLFIGGALDLRNAIGTGPVPLTKDDAQLLARLAVLQEDESVPALAVGYDGPSYEHGSFRGLYVALSKEIPTRLAFVQVHAGLNSGQLETFRADRDLRGSAALTTAIQNVGLFTEIDEVMDPNGPRWNAGVEVNFSPIVIALEFRDLASARPNLGVSRLLRLSYNGQF